MPEKAALAGSNLTAAGLEHRVSLTVADGSDFVRSLPDGIDLVLVDYGIPAFTPAFAALRDRMAPGCLLFVDGGPPDYWSTGAGASFRALLEEDPSFVVSILPMHRDELIAVRVPQ